MPRLSLRERRRRRRLERNLEYHLWKASLVREFVTKNGWRALRADVVVPPGERLFTWVRQRRVGYKNGTIPHWLVEECEAIPGWSWDPRRDKTRKNIDELRSFVNRHGWEALAWGTEVDGVRLSQWCAVRRSWYRDGKLEDWVVRALEAIPGWSWDRLSDIYTARLEAVKRYVRRHGSADVPQAAVGDDGELVGRWASHARELHRRGSLPVWVARELEALPGWHWEPRHAKQQRKLDVLRAFVDEQGWDALRATTMVNDKALGSWAYRRRTQYRDGGLEPWLRRGLEAIRGWRSWAR